jgi:ketosteroid isomerase-like protein
MADVTPERQVAIIRDYNETFMRRDLAGMRRHMAPDFIQWHSNIRRDFTIEEEMAILETVLGCSRIVFHTMRLTPLSGNVVMDEHKLDISLNDGRVTRDIPCSVLFHFRGDKIVRSEEYIDGMSVPLMDVLPTPNI